MVDYRKVKKKLGQVKRMKVPRDTDIMNSGLVALLLDKIFSEMDPIILICDLEIQNKVLADKDCDSIKKNLLSNDQVYLGTFGTEDPTVLEQAIPELGTVEIRNYTPQQSYDDLVEGYLNTPNTFDDIGLRGEKQQ